MYNPIKRSSKGKMGTKWQNSALEYVCSYIWKDIESKVKIS